jgi:hypothetical protein
LIVNVLCVGSGGLIVTPRPGGSGKVLPLQPQRGVFWRGCHELPLEGGCLCGGVRYRISGEPRSADYCHCRMCRRAAGSPVVARITVADAAFARTKGAPAVYRSSADAERLFCAACGTQLALRDEPDHVDVTLDLEQFHVRCDQ